MNPAEVFEENTRKAKVIAAVTILLIVIPMLIKYMGTEYGLSLSLSRQIALLPQIVSLGLIFWVLYLNKCPSCKKQAGTGWSIKECKHCGVSLQSNT
jgi:hypothetical protein